MMEISPELKLACDKWKSSMVEFWQALRGVFSEAAKIMVPALKQLEGIVTLTDADIAYLEKAFKHHDVSPENADKLGALRAAFKTVALQILINCPNSRERSVALTNLETAMFFANSSVARES